MKRKLIDDIKTSPSRFYRVPGDVIRDRRFKDEERLEILKAWEGALDESENAPTLLHQLMDAKKELERRTDPAAHD